MVKKIIDQYCRFLAVLLVAALALMVVLVFGNVVMRYGFNSGFTLSEELSRWLFVWMTFLGAIIAMHERGHLGTDSLVSRLPVRGKKICLGASYVLMLFCCWLIFKGSWDQTVINMKSTSAVMQVPMGILYASGIVFAVSATLILLYQFWRLLSGQMAAHELVGIQESEEQVHGEPASAASPARAQPQAPRTMP